MGTWDTDARRAGGRRHPAPVAGPGPTAHPCLARGHLYCVDSLTFGFVLPSLATTNFLQRKRKRERKKRPAQGTMISFLNEKRRSKGGLRIEGGRGEPLVKRPSSAFSFTAWGLKGFLGKPRSVACNFRVQKSPSQANKQTTANRTKHRKPDGIRRRMPASSR